MRTAAIPLITGRGFPPLLRPNSNYESGGYIMYNNENMPIDASIAGFAVGINEGKKIILYVDNVTARRIVDQLKENNGQLTQITANALATTVASTLKALDDYNHKMMREVNHKPSDPSYDIEEDDDPRTIFNGDNEEE